MHALLIFTLLATGAATATFAQTNQVGTDFTLNLGPSMGGLVERLRVTQGGRVGLGAIAGVVPSATLHVEGTDAHVMRLSRGAGFRNFQLYDNTFTIVGEHNGVHAINSTISLIRPGFSGTAYGWLSEARSTENANASALVGLTGRPYLSGSGTINNATAVDGEIYVWGPEASGTINNAVSLRASGFFYGGGATGTVNNAFGVYINPRGVGDNRWGIYQEGPNDNNYFAGRVGIGTAAPSGTLHVRGSVMTQQGTAAGGGNTAYLAFTDSNGTRMGYVGDGSQNNNDMYLTADNGAVRIMSGANGCTYSSGTSWTCSSDARMKEGVATLGGALDKVVALRGVTYRWKDEVKPGVRIGLIAQEVEKVFPEVVEMDADSGMRAVDYAALVAPLIEAVKELKEENDALKRRVGVLEQRD